MLPVVAVLTVTALALTVAPELVELALAQLTQLQPKAQ